ncbi:DsbA family oxidoreductase [Paenibacillus wulumuqiensis]|uniref:DsbA family oxidoreductase n=1 Tax=Paenibacillus wulumuqiensis TaxID=1567107 RepID=UPI000619E387|nr:DsbA family oxidoreductase [Paenibacillus wulumuqiensis]
MKIDIWSDYQCPFCYIGKTRLQNALSQFPHAEEVTVNYKSFELDPSAERDIPLNIYESLAKKYGTTIEQAREMNVNVGAQAAQEGLDFKFDTMILTNSFDAHRLMQYAADQGKAEEMNEALFRAYFTESRHIGDHPTLIDIAESVGLDREQTAAVLESEQYGDLVRRQEHLGSQLGITGVPFFVINDKYAVSGAQPTEMFTKALNDIWAEDHPLQMLGNSADGEMCTDGSCAAPQDRK